MPKKNCFRRKCHIEICVDENRNNVILLFLSFNFPLILKWLVPLFNFSYAYYLPLILQWLPPLFSCCHHFWFRTSYLPFSVVDISFDFAWVTSHFHLLPLLQSMLDVRFPLKCQTLKSKSLYFYIGYSTVQIEYFVIVFNTL